MTPFWQFGDRIYVTDPWSPYTSETLANTIAKMVRILHQMSAPLPCLIHLGQAEALDFYHLRLPLKRIHEINAHLNSCPTCDDFYVSVMAREGAA